MPSIVEKWLLGTTATLMGTELNSLASSSGLTAGAIGSAFNNVAGGGGFDGYKWGVFELNLGTPGGTMTAGTAAYIWFLQQIDGTNFEDGSASIIPARKADLVVPVRAIAVAGRAGAPTLAMLPPGTWKPLVSQNTGVAWAASGNTLKVEPVTSQGIY